MTKVDWRGPQIKLMFTSWPEQHSVIYVYLQGHVIQLERSYYSYLQTDCTLWANTAENTCVYLWRHKVLAERSAVLQAFDCVLIVHPRCGDPAVTPAWCGTTWPTNLKVRNEVWCGTLGWRLRNISPVCACECRQWWGVLSFSERPGCDPYENIENNHHRMKNVKLIEFLVQNFKDCNINYGIDYRLEH